MLPRQIIFLRNDLKSFGKGALVAQACHASTAATFTYLSHPDTKLYLERMAEMTKVVLKITGQDIEELTSELRSNEIDFIEWRESLDEGITCVSTRPFVLSSYPVLEKYLLKFKLF